MPRRQERRFGATMSIMQANVLDRIAAAGDDGIDAVELGMKNGKALKSIIYNINACLEETDLVLRTFGGRRGQPGRVKLIDRDG